MPSLGPASRAEPSDRPFSHDAGRRCQMGNCEVGYPVQLLVTRLARQLVAASLICPLGLADAAQAVVQARPAPPSPTRTQLRIAGAATYEVPGIIKVERNRVTGSPVRQTELFVQVRSGDDSRLLTVPLPGKKLCGRARVIDGDLLELVVEREPDLLYVPLGSIVRTEYLGPRPMTAGNVIAIMVGVAVAVFVMGFVSLSQLD
jgi:hypothetical protein